MLRSASYDCYDSGMVGHNRIEEISNAAIYIEARLDQAITIQKIATEIGLSSFHFQRLFFFSLGESVSDYIRRRRLEKGAKLLLSNPKQSIIEIGLESGFESHSAFSRAFKMHYGQSPTAFRASTWPDSASDTGDNRPFLIPSKSSQLELLPDLVDLPELWFLYREQQGMKDGTYFSADNQLASEFSELANSVAATMQQGFWAYSGAYKGGPGAFSDASAIGCYGGIFEQEPTLDWSKNIRKMPAGKWAVFSHYGEFDYLYLTWNKLIRNWLPSSCFSLRSDWAFETYLKTPGKIAPREASAQIYLPVKQKA